MAIELQRKGAKRYLGLIGENTMKLKLLMPLVFANLLQMLLGASDQRVPMEELIRKVKSEHSYAPEIDRSVRESSQFAVLQDDMKQFYSEIKSVRLFDQEVSSYNFLELHEHRPLNEVYSCLSDAYSSFIVFCRDTDGNCIVFRSGVENETWIGEFFHEEIYEPEEAGIIKVDKIAEDFRDFLSKALESDNRKFWLK